MEPILIIEIVLAVVALGFGIFIWYKEKNLQKGIDALGLLFPTIESMAKQTENKIDDEVIRILKSVISNDTKEKIEEAKKK